MTRDDEEQVDSFLKAAAKLTPKPPTAPTAPTSAQRGQQDLSLWRKWDQGGRKEEDLHPLFEAVQPYIRSETRKRLSTLGGSIPAAAMENELRVAAKKQFETFDPNRGTKLTTHVGQGFRRVSDFEHNNRNARSMSTEDSKHYQAFSNAREELKIELGRDPTAEELRERLPQWGMQKVKRMQRGFGRELYTDMGDGLSINDDFARPSHHDAFQLVRSQLTPQEVEFGRHFFPPEGTKPKTPQQIARVMGIPNHKAYALKASLDTRMGRLLRKE